MSLISIGQEYTLQPRRVRKIIPHMSVTELNKSKLHPCPMIAKVVKKDDNFPKVTKKGGYVWFGIFVDYFIRDFLSTNIVPVVQYVHKVFRSTLSLGRMKRFIEFLIRYNIK